MFFTHKVVSDFQAATPLFAYYTMMVIDDGRQAMDDET
jgi:hypothetical protein